MDIVSAVVGVSRGERQQWWASIVVGVGIGGREQ